MLIRDQALVLDATQQVVEHGDVFDGDKVRYRINLLIPEIVPDNIVEATALVAMNVIGERRHTTLTNMEPIEGVLATDVTALCFAWVHGVMRNDPIDISKIEKIAASTPDDEAVQAMAIRAWAGALVALLQHDRTEARRLWRRAMDIAGSFGVESQQAITWTYMATFFPT